MATAARSSTTAPPATASRFFRNCRHAWLCIISRSVFGGAALLATSGLALSGHPDTGIHQSVRDVGQDVPEQGQTCPDDDERHEDRLVPRKGALVEELPHPG